MYPESMKMCILGHVLRDVRETAPALGSISTRWILGTSCFLVCLFYFSYFPVSTPLQSLLVPSGLLLNPITNHRSRAKIEDPSGVVFTDMIQGEPWRLGWHRRNRWKATNKPSSTNAVLSHQDTLPLCGKDTS